MKRFIRRLMMRKRSALPVRIQYWLEHPDERADLLQRMSVFAYEMDRDAAGARLLKLCMVWRAAARAGDWRDMAALAKKRIRE